MQFPSHSFAHNLETFRTDKLQHQVQSKEHSDEGSDTKKVKDQAENLLSNFFLAGVEGQISVKLRQEATNSSTSEKSHQLCHSGSGLSKTSSSKEQVA